MFYGKLEYTIMQSGEEEKVEPNVFRNSIFKAWADSPVCELIDVLTIISEMNHYIKTISYFDNYNDQLIDAIRN